MKNERKAQNNFNFMIVPIFYEHLITLYYFNYLPFLKKFKTPQNFMMLKLKSQLSVTFFALLFPLTQQSPQG